MKRHIILLISIVGILQFGYASDFHSMDSLGTVQKGNQKFVIHQVDAGETLFALSRKYNVSVQEIKDANTESLTSLNIGQKVLVPLMNKPAGINGKTHKVKSSETLFSISRNYNVQVDDLRKWNNLSGNSISVGQELIIEDGNDSKPTESVKDVKTDIRRTHTVQESQTLYAISRMYDVTTDEIIEWNNLSSSNLNIGQVLIVADAVNSVSEVANNSSMLPVAESTNNANKPVEKVEETKPDKSVSTPVVSVPETMVIEENIPDKIEAPVEKVIQKGLAEVIADTENTKKYLAMHRDAPIGTIMQVKNEMNNQTVFVRVVGPIQPTGDNGKIILMISKKAFDRLGAVDNRFPVEISFIP